jgi:hypothetical protein
VPHQEALEGYDTGEICLLCGNRGLAAAQQVFLYFARRGLGEFANERNPTGRFEVSKIVSRELDDFGFRGGFAGTQHNERMRRFTPFRVRHADDRDLLHGVVTKQHALTSTDEMFSPPLMMTSLNRSRIST